MIPMFSELRPLLEHANHAADAGDVYVIRRYRGGNANLRTYATDHTEGWRRLLAETVSEPASKPTDRIGRL